MLFGLSFLSLIAAGSAMTLPQTYEKRSGSVMVTPHDQYSSSIGVLGCKINTNRVAYWPSPPGCEDICVKVSANGRSVYLLKIDQSGGAYDISYGAWNYLNTGDFAKNNPTTGGGIAATYEYVDGDYCQQHLHHTDPKHTDPNDKKHKKHRKLAFSAANSMDFLTSCDKNSWVRRNLALYNIYDTACNWGYDIPCQMPDLSVSNQPTCHDSTLGAMAPLESCPVYNVQYGTGKRVLAQN